MITSVFSKSRPINYILVTFLLVLCFIVLQISSQTQPWTLLPIAKKVFLLFLLVGSLFITNFITIKNGLSKDNSYTFLLFALFLILFPETLQNIKLVASNALLLLAMRRLIAMQSMKFPKEKIFDASFWIFTASLLNFWCLLFILLVFASIIFHVSRDYKNWIIPFTALFAVLTIALMAVLIIDPLYIQQYLNTIQLDFKPQYLQNIFKSVSLVTYIAVALLALVSMLFILPTKISNVQSSYRKIIFAFLIALIIYFISPYKSNGYLIYTFVPVAIMLTNYLETINKYWVKETIITTILLISLVTYCLQTLQINNII